MTSRCYIWMRDTMHKKLHKNDKLFDKLATYIYLSMCMYRFYVYENTQFYVCQKGSCKTLRVIHVISNLH